MLTSLPLPSSSLAALTSLPVPPNTQARAVVFAHPELLQVITISLLSSSPQALPSPPSSWSSVTLLPEPDGLKISLLSPERCALKAALPRTLEEVTIL